MKLFLDSNLFVVSPPKLNWNEIDALSEGAAKTHEQNTLADSKF